MSNLKVTVTCEVDDGSMDFTMHFILDGTALTQFDRLQAILQGMAAAIATPPVPVTAARMDLHSDAPQQEAEPIEAAQPAQAQEEQEV